MQQEINILKKSRQLTLKAIENCTIEQLNKIPERFKNSIAWNITHLVVTQQLLCYKLSGLECLVSEEMIHNFQKGTAPTYSISENEFEAIKKQFISLPEILEEDYSKGIFKKYIEYKTSVEITLNSIEDGVIFNNYHEGIHLGIILQLLKFI
ncbi:MAG: DinB family protein [Lutibacter sp.]|uniref:DinB family protein n=1 Tax=Lutibacter sp. TaxID=1925666 RepID=UPI00385F52CB